MNITSRLSFSTLGFQHPMSDPELGEFKSILQKGTLNPQEAQGKKEPAGRGESVGRLHPHPAPEGPG